MADKPQIAGLPPGAELKPIQGLPEGAELRPVASAQTAEPDDRNRIQKAFDTATTVTPEQEKGHSWLTNKVQEFGAGAIQGAAQPFVHPIETAKGIARFAANPMLEGGQMASEVAQHPAQALGNVVGGAAMGEGIGAGAKLAGPILDRIPSFPTRAKAGAIFEDLNQKLANQPVKLAKTLQPLQRATELGERGGVLPGSVNKFLQRSQSPIDMTFPEARDYQSNLSSLSREDQGNMTGPMRGGVKQLNKAYFEDMKDAAGPYGADYEKAMTMNRRANQVRDVAGKVAKIAVPAVIGGTAYKLSKVMER